ncbi:MAG: tetratricopeptide repeat protein [Planctomycetia bacterium]|nr:tetratricopeptide repeat protein [Planctomycetia bacterium]
MDRRVRILEWALAIIGLLLLAAAARADEGDDLYTVGASHYAAGRWDLAATEFQSLLSRHPQHTRATEAEFFLGESLSQSHHYREAADAYARLLNQKPPQRLVGRALFRRGEALYLAGDSKQAEQVLGQFLESYSNDPATAHALFYRGASLLDLNRAAEAQPLFERVLAKSASGNLTDLCRLGRAQAAERQSHFDQAAEGYQQLLAAANSSTAGQARLRLGMLEARRQHYAAAIKLLKPLMADKANAKSSEIATDDAHYWLAISYQAAGEHQAALDLFLPMTSVTGPRTDEARFRAGSAMASLGQRPAAHAMFEQIGAKSDWADQALCGRVQIAAADGDDSEMLRRLFDLQKQYPKSELIAPATEIAAQRLAKSDRIGPSIELLERQAAADSGTPCWPYLLAVAYSAERRYADALTQLDRVLKSSDETFKPNALACQGKALVALGRFADAASPLAEYVRLRPAGIHASTCRGYLAVCYVRTKHVPEARELDAQLEAKTSQDPSRPTATLALAEAALSAGELAWSESLFQRVIDRDGPIDLQTRALAGLAKCQLSAGRHADAAVTADILLACKPSAPMATRAYMTQAIALEKLGRRDEALVDFQHVIDQTAQHPPASGESTNPQNAMKRELPIALLRAATILEAKGQPADSLKLYDQLLADCPSALEVDAALYQSAWLLESQKQHDDAQARFKTLHEKHPQSRFWADATYRLAAAALKAKQYDEAHQLIGRLATTRPAEDVLAHALLLDGERAAAQGQWQEAGEIMASLLARHPNDDVRIPAEFWQAEAAYHQEHFDEARQGFNNLAKQPANQIEAWACLISLRRGQLAAMAKDWLNAGQLAQGLRENHPDFDQQFEVDYLLGRCLMSEARFDEARKAFERVTASETGGKTETAAMARWMIGETLMHQQLHELAVREYLRAEALYAYPRWQAASLLQAGKCYEQLRRWDDAAALYNRIVSQYGQTMFRDEAQTRMKSLQRQIGQQGTRQQAARPTTPTK